jgi:hypothetical protein
MRSAGKAANAMVSGSGSSSSLRAIRHRMSWAVAFLTAWMLSSISFASAQQPGASVESLYLGVTDRMVSARVTASGVATSATVLRPLRQAVVNAEEWFVVGKRSFADGGRTYFFVVTQTRSTGERTTGHCGAGTEDTLRLVEWQKKERRLVERDSLLLQSCLKSLSLSDDSGRPLRRLLEHAEQPQAVRVLWLDHPTFGSRARTVAVRAGRIVVE